MTTPLRRVASGRPWLPAQGALKAEILRAIRAVANGEAIFGPVIAKRLINYFAAPRPSAPAVAIPELTEREKEILALLAQHQTNPEIARRLHLSPKTIRNPPGRAGEPRTR